MPVCSHGEGGLSVMTGIGGRGGSQWPQHLSPALPRNSFLVRCGVLTLGWLSPQTSDEACLKAKGAAGVWGSLLWGTPSPSGRPAPAVWPSRLVGGLHSLLPSDYLDCTFVQKWRGRGGGCRVELWAVGLTEVSGALQPLTDRLARPPSR